jgi:hypothetical protein
MIRIHTAEQQTLEWILRMLRAADAKQMPSPTCSGCGGLQRDLVAVERLKTRAYVLRTFRCPCCRSDLRLVGPSGKETDSAYRRREAARAAPAWWRAPRPAADRMVGSLIVSPESGLSDDVAEAY